MKYKKTLTVPTEEAQQLERFCEEPPGDCGRGEVLFDKTVVFPNKNQVDVQVIASEEPETESCWTQAVLFDSEGNELACTDVGESFLGEFYVYYDDDEYVVDVITEDCVPINGDALENHHVMTQWAYSNRFYHAARWVGQREHAERRRQHDPGQQGQGRLR